jgi:tetratricopeptide (TPR) repeat protein
MDQEKPITSNSMIDEEKSKSMSSSPKPSLTTTAAYSNRIHQRRRIIQNFLVIWLTADIDQSEQDRQSVLTQLRDIVNDVNIFTQPDECVDFLKNIDDIKVFLIVSSTFGQQIVPLIHDVSQLNGVYIFFSTYPEREQWVKEWMKVKGIHTEITPIGESLQQAVRQYNQDSIAVSFVTVNEEASIQNLDQLESAFMYTQIFKEILLEMNDNEQSIKDIVSVLRNYYINNNSKLNVIAEFERDYCPNSSIWWYTREYFLYQTLNRALRTLEVDTIINMGFFIRHLHRQIEQLHQQQIGDHHEQPFIVYRGQGLSTKDFEKLLKTKGGLISFNNFLSTSKDEEVSFVFADSASMRTDMVGILFKMSIDPSVSSAPFASIQEVSYFQTEEEILFSMHTVFRIGEITQIDNNNLLYQVDLKLTADDDQQLRILTERIAEEVVGKTGWERLSQLLLKLSQFDKAEELYNVLLEQTSSEDEKALFYNQLGYVKADQGDYEKAFEYYEKALEIDQKTLPPNHPSLAISYNNIAGVYHNMGEYLKATSFYEKALEIFEKTLSPNHPSLATSYNNIGSVYNKIGDYSKALLFYEKALDIKEKILPPNHPSLATSYNSIGSVYDNMGDYSKALSFFEKDLEICQKTLPSNHTSLAPSYNNIGSVYDKMGEYSKALSFYEKDFEICQKTLPSNHPSLASSYSNIGSVYDKMGEYSKALSFFEKALQIFEKTLPPNHPSLATSYNNIGLVCCNIGEYSKALSFYEKDFEICQKTLPPNHPSLASSYSNIGSVYDKMGEYSKALSFFEKALQIFEKTLPPNHPSLATSYNNIGLVCSNIGEYSKALSFYEKALEVFEKTLSLNHPSLATSYINMGSVYGKMREYSKALSFYEKALEIQQKTLPPNHSLFATFYNNIAFAYHNMGEYSKALSYLEHALNILQCSLPPNHASILNMQQGIRFLKKKL